MIFRARLKPIDQIPEWAKCCQTMLDRAATHANEVIEVNSGVYLQDAKCEFCHRVIENLRCLRRVDRPDFAIVLDCYDLDEGEASS
jgi:hypothetical protein